MFQKFNYVRLYLCSLSSKTNIYSKQIITEKLAHNLVHFQKSNEILSGLISLLLIFLVRKGLGQSKEI